MLVIALVLLGTSIYVGGEEEEQHLNTNSCVNCDLSNAWLEEADLRKADFSGAKFTCVVLSNVRLRGAI